MSGIDYSQPLLGAGAQAKNDWSSASARTSLDFSGAAQFRRGVRLEIGAAALASADAQFQQFLSAMVRGNAFADAHAKLQVQLLLNLFDEAGLSVGAEAAAQAAAGIEAGLGLSIGDFIRLAKADREMTGLPLYLLTILLEETDIGGKVQVNVAAAAMAYASVSITGCVIDRPGRPAGFEYVVDAGLGVAAGVGFSAGLSFGFKNFRRFYGRAVDCVVDETVSGIAQRLPESPSILRDGMVAVAPVAKMSLRIAYELGNYIANNLPGRSRADAANLCNHCVGIVLEEAQRFVFQQIVASGLERIRSALRNTATQMSREWAAAASERETLALILTKMPTEPFAFTADNSSYWRGLVDASVAFLIKLPSLSSEYIASLAALYAASDLLLETMRSKIEHASSYAMAVGAGRVAAELPFSSELSRPPAKEIRAHINSTLRRPVGQRINRGDLVRFLSHATVIAGLRASIPQVDAFFRVFKGPVARTEELVCQLLIANRAAFVPGAEGVDPKASLQVLLRAIDDFVTEVLQAQIVPAVARHSSSAEQRLYFGEVLLPSMLFVKDVAFDAVLNWERRPVDRGALTEALASVVMLLLGRSLVIGGDAFISGVQEQMRSACENAATNLTGARSPLPALGLENNPETVDLLRSTLEIGGEIFGPLPEGSRKRLRELLYQVFETLPPSRQKDFLTDLGDQFFIPNKDDLDAVAKELLTISSGRFARFVELLFHKFGDWVAASIDRMLQELQAALREWERELDRAILRVFGQLQRLERDLQVAIAQTQDSFDEATTQLHETVTALGSDRVRDRLRDKLVESFQGEALDLLRANPVYKALPLREAKTLARDTVKTVVRGLVGSAVIDPILDLVGAIARDLNPLASGLDELDPRRPLAGQLLALVLAEMDRRLNGLVPPSIQVGFNISFDFAGRQNIGFSLGRISLPRANLKGLVREAIASLNFYEAQLNAAAVSTKAWFDAVRNEQLARARRNSASEQHDLLSRLNAEHSATAKQVRILKPGSGVMLSPERKLQIETVGMPRSYLGLGRHEHKRFIVAVNGHYLDVSAAQLSTVSNGPSRGGLNIGLNIPPSVLLRGANVVTVAILDRGGRVLKDQVTFSHAETNRPAVAPRDVGRVTRGSLPLTRLAEAPVGLALVRGNSAASAAELVKTSKASTAALKKLGARPRR